MEKLSLFETYHFMMEKFICAHPTMRRKILVRDDDPQIFKQLISDYGRDIKLIDIVLPSYQFMKKLGNIRVYIECLYIQNDHCPRKCQVLSPFLFLTSFQ